MDWLDSECEHALLVVVFQLICCAGWKVHFVYSAYYSQTRRPIYILSSLDSLILFSLPFSSDELGSALRNEKHSSVSTLLSFRNKYKRHSLTNEPVFSDNFHSVSVMHKWNEHLSKALHTSNWKRKVRLIALPRPVDLGYPLARCWLHRRPRSPKFLKIWLYFYRWPHESFRWPLRFSKFDQFRVSVFFESVVSPISNSGDLWKPWQQFRSKSSTSSIVTGDDDTPG